MSDQVPTKAYVYQPRPANHPEYPRIYAVAGPGSKHWQGEHYTKDHAQAIADMINTQVLTASALIAMGSTPDVQASVRRGGR